MFFDHTLPNGVRIVGQKLPYFHSISIGAWVGAGSVKEEPCESGITHFIEHMLFKGTERRSAQQIAGEIDSLGAQINAFTAKECTCYYIRATKEHLAASMDMLGDIMLYSRLDPAEMEKEKGVVLEEILMVEDVPEDLAMEALSATCFNGHPLGRPILGSKESVSSFSQADLRSYMDKHYTPDNILIAIAGNFDETELLEAVQKSFDFTGGQQKKPYPEPPKPMGKRVAIREKDIEQVHICLASPGYGAYDDRFFPLMVLNNALGGNMSSRLFQKIREEKGLAYSVYSFTSSYRDNGTLGYYAGTNSNTAVEVLQLILDEIRLVRQNGITQEEFTRSKNQLRGSFVLSNENAGSRMMSIGKNTLLYGYARTEEETLQRLDNVNMDSVSAILSNVLDESSLCAAFVGRLGDRAQQMEVLW